MQRDRHAAQKQRRQNDSKHVRRSGHFLQHLHKKQKKGKATGVIE